MLMKNTWLRKPCCPTAMFYLAQCNVQNPLLACLHYTL